MDEGMDGRVTNWMRKRMDEKMNGRVTKWMRK